MAATYATLRAPASTATALPPTSPPPMVFEVSSPVASNQVTMPTPLPVPAFTASPVAVTMPYSSMAMSRKLVVSPAAAGSAAYCQSSAPVPGSRQYA